MLRFLQNPSHASAHPENGVENMHSIGHPSDGVIE